MGPTNTAQPPRRGVGRDSGSRPPVPPPRLPDAAHREGDIPDAAHGVAVVSRVDSPGEDLMQMHLRSPGRQGTAREERRAPRRTARAPPPPPPSGPTPRRLRLNASPPSRRPPSSSLPWEAPRPLPPPGSPLASGNARMLPVPAAPAHNCGRSARVRVRRGGRGSA